MWIDEAREIVTSYATGIIDEIKRIDKDYFVVRNHEDGVFEIHHGTPCIGRGMATWQLTIPYPELDQRTIDYIHKTKIENIKEVMSEIEEKNEKVVKNARKKKAERDKEIAKDIARYTENHFSKDDVDDKAYTTRFI
ncbi:MAG TPA: hypothetical protein VEF53_18960 [Patescibacteria group bacterium]|nr:hypothetical protein [Patescibacteria group bacterium]